MLKYSWWLDIHWCRKVWWSSKIVRSLYARMYQSLRVTSSKIYFRTFVYISTLTLPLLGIKRMAVLKYGILRVDRAWPGTKLNAELRTKFGWGDLIVWQRPDCVIILRDDRVFKKWEIAVLILHCGSAKRADHDGSKIHGCLAFICLLKNKTN